MTKKALLSTLFALCLGCLSVSAQSYANPTLKTIHERTSVRSFTSQAVSKETLVELVKAGMAAPTGANKQPWEFIIIQDKATLSSFATMKPPLKTAAAAIVVLGDASISGSWTLDCAAATENILLAATSMGLGTVWTGAYGNSKFEALLMGTLELPDGILPLAVIAIGYPDGTPTPKDKYIESKVHFEKY